MSTNSKKRRTPPETPEENPEKRVRLAPEHLALNPFPSSAEIPTSSSNTHANATASTSTLPPKQKKNKHKSPKISELVKKRVKINKLVAPKPFPAIAVSASATSPRSTHKEGKNYICLTRKTSLGAYMRRCKNLVINDGYKTLHLHAAGAAIPLLLQLTCALPPILPFSRDEIHTSISTGTVEVQDEIIPEDEDEDLAYRTRGKSTLYIIFHICDGSLEKSDLKATGDSRPPRSRARPKKSAGNREILVYEEPEQEQEDI